MSARNYLLLPLWTRGDPLKQKDNRHSLTHNSLYSIILDAATSWARPRRAAVSGSLVRSGSEPQYKCTKM